MFTKPSKNPHRAMSLMTDVMKELTTKLRTMTNNSMYIQVKIGDGHFCDRVADRSNNVEIAVRNIKYIINRIIDENLCELIYIQNRCRLEGTACRCIGVYSFSEDHNIAIGFDFPAFAGDNKLVLVFRTYVVDHLARYEISRNNTIPYYRFDVK